MVENISIFHFNFVTLLFHRFIFELNFFIDFDLFLSPNVVFVLFFIDIILFVFRQMRAAGNALRTAGLRRREVLQIARRHPPVLGRDPTLLINLISFLRFNCGLHKVIL